MKYRDAVANFEHTFLEEQLYNHQWNIVHTAQDLGIHRGTLHRKIRELNIINGGERAEPCGTPESNREPREI